MIIKKKAEKLGDNQKRKVKIFANFFFFFLNIKCPD